MQCKIKGATVACEHIYFQELNFGQEVSNLTSVEYDLVISLTEFTEAMNTLYNQFVEDAKRFPDEDDKLEAKLNNVGWLPLSELAVHYPVLVRDFAEWASYDVITTIFSREKWRGQPSYIINSVEIVKLEENTLILSGKAIQVEAVTGLIV